MLSLCSRFSVMLIVCFSFMVTGLHAVEPSIAIAVTSNGQPVAEGQTVSGVVDITVTVTDGMGMHVSAYGNMIVLPFNEPGSMANTAVWSHTTQVDTQRFYDGENLLSVHVHPHHHMGDPYGTDLFFATFKLVTENVNPAPNGDRLLPTLSFIGSWIPNVWSGEAYLSGNALVNDDKTSSYVGQEQLTAAPVQIIAHLGESVLGRFRWNTLTPPFGDMQLVSQCHLRPFQRDQAFNTQVVFFFTDGAGRANYATRPFTMPALSANPGVYLPMPCIDAKIIGLGNGDTLRVPDGGSTPLYVQVSNLTSGVFTYPEMTTWIGNRAVKVTNLLSYVNSLPEGVNSVIVEVPIPADEVLRLQAARQGGEMSTATPIWVDFNAGTDPCLPTSSHVHLNSIRTTSYPWPYGEPTVVIKKPWNNSGHWTGTTLDVRYDQWGPLPAGYQVRWKINSGSWQVDDGDGQILLSGLTRQTHHLEIELTDAELVRLPGAVSFAEVNFTVANAAPVAVAEVYSVMENDTLNVTGSGVLLNDQDPDGDLITAVLATQPRHGTVNLASDGSFTYVPSLGYVGYDRFTYRAMDNSLSSRETDVSIQVAPATNIARVLGDWPMLGRDAEHAGYIRGFLGSIAPTLSWTGSFPPGSSTLNKIKGSAVMAGRVVSSIKYSNEQIRVACFNATSGQREWETLLDVGDVSGPAIGNGLAYVQRTSQMVALDLSSGAIRWTTPYIGQSSRGWAPTVADGGVWVQGGYAGDLYGYDALTGSQLFFYDKQIFDNWTPAYRIGKVFTWLQGTVRRHHALTGTVELSKALISAETANGSVETMPVLVDDRLVLCNRQIMIAADQSDFSVYWQQVPLTGSWVRTPVVHDGIVYALTNYNKLETLDLVSGRQMGEVALPNVPISDPIITDDAIIVSCSTNYPYNGVTLVIDRTTLTVRYTIPRGGTLALADNALFITDVTANIASPSVRRYVFNSDVPSVSWVAESQTSVSESGTMTVTAQLSAAVPQDVSVPFTVTGIATSSDYVITAGPIIIPAGATTGSTTITIIDDALDEDNESVVLLMGTPTNATAGATTVHTAIITDDDVTPTVAWTTGSQSSVNENGNLTVTAQLSAASGQNVIVPFSVTGTATGADYTIAASPLTIAAGATTGSVTIAITADTLNEGNETIILTMGTPTNAVLGATTVHSATITDDDPIPTVAWSTASQSSVNESGTLTVTAQLSAASGQNITVPFTVAGTATLGGDYVLSMASPITIPAGATSSAVKILIVNDMTVEENETVILTMGTPTYATAGATTDHTATISNMPPVNTVEPGIAIAVTSNGQPISEGQAVSGTVDVTVTVVNGMGMHVTAYGNMIVLPFNESGSMANMAVWSHTTQVDTQRFYDGENLLSVHAHPHHHMGDPYGTDLFFETFKLITENVNPTPNGDRLLPTLSIGSGWTPTISNGEAYLSGDASVVDDRTTSGVDRNKFTAVPVQIIAHLGESVLGRFRWNKQTPPFGDQQLVAQCHLRPFQRDQAFNTKVVFFFTDGAGRANYGTRSFTVPALPTTSTVDLTQPFLDAKILGVGNGGTLRVPANGTIPLYVEVKNIAPGLWSYPEMTTWIGNRAVHVTKLMPLIDSLPAGANNIIVEVPIPGNEIQLMQQARQGGEMGTAMPIWIDFNLDSVPCLPTSSHVHLNSVRTTDYSWSNDQPTVVITKPWDSSNHWTGTSMTARYDYWGALSAGVKIRWNLNGGAWQIDDGDGQIELTGLTQQTHQLNVELADAGNIRLPGATSFATTSFSVVGAAPVAASETFTVSVNSVLNMTTSVLANDQDADGDLMTAILVTQPRHGTVDLSETGTFVYTPTADYIGMDRFSYRATDGSFISNEADVSIQVTPSTSGARIIGDWPMLGRDAQHAGYMSGYLGNEVPSLAWTSSFPSGSSTVNSLKGTVVMDGKVVSSIDYYSYGQIRVACFDALTGQQQWERLLNSGDISSPAIGNGMVYVQRANHSTDSQMIALSLATGAVQWSTPYSDQWTADWAPTVADGSLWVSGGYSGGMYGYDAVTGAQRFWLSLPQYYDWTPAYANGKLFTWMQGTVRKHNPLNGTVELSKKLKTTSAVNGWVQAMPVYVDDRVVLRDDELLAVVNQSDLSVYWQRQPLVGLWKGSPVIHDGIIYARTSFNTIECLDLYNGRQLGQIALPNSALGDPIVTDDAIIVSCNTSYPYTGVTQVIDRVSLSVRYTLPHGGSLALADNALYITDVRTNLASPSVRRYAFTVLPPTNTPPDVNAGPDQTVDLANGTAATPVAGASIYLNAGLDDGANATWEDTQKKWNVSIDAGVNFVANAGSSLPGITAAYAFPGGLSGSGGCVGPALQDMGVDKKPITLELWFKPNASASYPANGQVLWETGGGTGLGIFYRNGMIETAHDSNAGQMSADVSALTGEFIQVVVTYDPTSTTNNFKLYINGALQATTSRSDTDMCGGDDAGLGKRGQSNVGGAGSGDSNTVSFDGMIAIFRSYHDLVLDAAQVQTNFLSVTSSTGSVDVVLNGSASDADNDPLTTTWSVFAGDGPVVFADAAAVNTTATFTVPGTYTLRLTADDTKDPRYDDVVITVNDAGTVNEAPVANAGSDQSVTDGDRNGTENVTLTGAASSDSDGTIVSYEWHDGTSQIATGVSPTVSLAVGDHTITLTVTDDEGATATDTVLITVNAAPNASPVVNAGPDQTVPLVDGGGSAVAPVTGANIYLNAGLDDGANATWEDSQTTWNVAIDTGVSFVANAGSAHPGITSAYSFPGGGIGCSGVSFQNLAADRQPITLELWFKPAASTSYPANGQVLWETGGGTGFGIFYRDGMVETAHDNNAARLSANVSALIGDFVQVVVTYDTTATIDNFKLYINGVLQATGSRSDGDLSGSDGAGLGKRGGSNVGGAGSGDSSTTSFEGQIALFRSYHNVILDAAQVQTNYDSVATSGAGASATVVLDGTVSDPDNDQLTTTWSVVSGPGSVVFADASAVDTTATMTVAGTYVLRLTADDTITTPGTDEVEITVTDGTVPNVEPVANAGADESVTDTDGNGSELVTLTGAGSSDSDGTIVSYEWSEGVTPIATGVSPTVSLAVGDHTITLTVTDDDGATATDTVLISVNAPVITTTVPLVDSTDRLAWFTFDTDTSDVDGTLSLSLTGAQVGVADGKFDGAFRAAAAGNYGTIADHSLLNTGGPWSARTIAVWFKLDAISGRQVVFEEGGSSRGFNSYVDNGTLYVGGWDKNKDGTDVDTWAGTWLNLGTVAAGQWYHVALVLDATTNPTQLSGTAFTGYLNGVAIASGNGMQISAHADDFGIGAVVGSTLYHDAATNGNAVFVGNVDDLVIWNRVLTPAEIMTLVGGAPASAAEGETPPFVPPTNG